MERYGGREDKEGGIKRIAPDLAAMRPGRESRELGRSGAGAKALAFFHERASKMTIIWLSRTGAAIFENRISSWTKIPIRISI